MSITQQSREILLLTGMSGAGKSQALKTLEDMGFEAIDNIPLSLLEAVLVRGGRGPSKLAIGVDVRSREFSPETVMNLMQRWRADSRLKAQLVFLECEDDVLQRRFTETRRKHPLAQDRPVSDGIALERELLAPVKHDADAVVNTTRFSVHDLKRYIHDHFSSSGGSELLLFVTSFSFREGIPRDSDMVMDVRFLANPHYDEVLRPLNGKDAPVAEYIEKDKDFQEFFKRFTELLTPLLPRYKAEGKSYFTVSIGCTGGKHRSVFVTEKLAGFLSTLGYKVGIRHRDLK